MARVVELDRGAPIEVETVDGDVDSNRRIKLIAVKDRRNYRQMTQTQALELAKALIETVVEIRSEATE